MMPPAILAKAPGSRLHGRSAATYAVPRRPRSAQALEPARHRQDARHAGSGLGRAYRKPRRRALRCGFRRCLAGFNRDTRAERQWPDGGNQLSVVGVCDRYEWLLFRRERTLTITTSLPPSPLAIAPPTNATTPADIAGDTAFLYTGADPIQHGVAQGTIDPRRVAILRGLVTQPRWCALPGVQITCSGSPRVWQHQQPRRWRFRSGGQRRRSADGRLSERRLS